LEGEWAREQGWEQREKQFCPSRGSSLGCPITSRSQHGLNYSGSRIIIIIIIIVISMWNVKTKVTPVIIGATGTISKSFRKYLSSVRGKHDIKELQKTAILGPAHILQKVLM
jgi:hypothetical protein